MQYIKWILISFVVLCGLLVVDSGIFKKTSPGKISPILLQTTTTEPQVTPNTPVAKDPNIPENDRLQADASISFGADNAPAKTIILGAADPKTEDPKTGFEFQLELSSKGAAIRTATFRDGI